MESDRHFKNPYPAFTPEISEQFIDLTLLKPTEGFKHNVKRSLLDLIHYLEEKLPGELDWKDTSIYTGASGYVFLYLSLAEKLNDEKYFKKAIPLAEKSLKYLKGRKISFLCGDAGPLALGCIVFHKTGQTSDLEFCLSNLVKLKRDALDIDSGLPDELLYGRAGYLYALLVVKQKLAPSVVDSDLLRSIILAILESGKLLAKKVKMRAPLMYEWHDKKYLGAAHGLCGILTLLLQIRQRMTTSEVDTYVRPTIDFLATCMFPSGNMASSIGSSSDRLVHWCHGAPGAIFLFSMAYEAFKDEQYLKLAKQCADVIWSRGLLRKGYGLCHGTAGNGYALLYLFKVTKDPKYLYEACQFARWCQNYGKHGCRTPDRPFSLYEGLAGTIHFLLDILDVNEAKFPAFIL